MGETKSNILTANTMGYLLHVAKEYNVEWAETKANKWECQDFLDLMSACGIDGVGEPLSTIIETLKEQWEQALWKLKNIEKLSEEDRIKISNALENLHCTKDEASVVVEDFLELSDSEKGMVYFRFL